MAMNDHEKIAADMAEWLGGYLKAGEPSEVVSAEMGVKIGAVEDARLGLANEPSYPEHDKLIGMKPEIDAVADFLEKVINGAILVGKGGYARKLCLAVEYSYEEAQDSGWYDQDEGPVAVTIVPSIEPLLAQWSGVNQNKLETEKRQMLENQRKLNERGEAG